MIRIHINSRQGMFTVDKYNSEKLWLSTKQYEFTTDTKDFKCIAGGINTCRNTQELHDFQMIVDKDYQELELRTQALLRLIGKHETVRTEYPEHYPTEEDFEEPRYEEEPDYDPFLDDEEYYDAYEQEEPSYDQYKKWYEQEQKENTKLRSKLMDIAKALYSNLDKLDLSEYENTKGIKFIIQSRYNDRTDTRFCFDPYAILDNYHSNISEAYSDQGYGTDNGGWVKVTKTMVILYSKSGDYGKYSDNVAIKAASKIFPNRPILSYSGKDWDIHMDNLIYPNNTDDLPF